jgi:hypothetical protein
METMVCYQARAGYGDVTKAFGPEDDIPEAESTDDALAQFLADAELRAVGVDPAKFHSQVAHIGKRADAIYKKIAAAAIEKKSAPAEKREDPQSLNKRFTKGEKAARVDKSANGKWQMEYAADGRLLRGYEI